MKQNLTMDGTTARKIYPNAAPELKAILEDSFGKEFFSQKITDRIKTLDDAYEAVGQTRPDDEQLLGMGLTPDEIACRHLKVVAKALNEGWSPDMYDTDQYKYWPWFEIKASSFAFRATYYSHSHAHAGYASRLCFKSVELARYAGEQFTDLYEAHITK